MTLKQINAAIQAKAPNVTLYKGEGYLYYIYCDNAAMYECESVYVPFLNRLPADRWIKDGIDFARETEEKAANRSSGFTGGPFAMGGSRLVLENNN